MFEPQKKTLAILIGGVKPTETNGFAGAVKGGPAVGLQYLYFPWDWAGLGAEILVFQLGKNQAKTDIKGLDVPVRINLLRERAWTPYVLGGVGVHQFEYSYNGSALSTTCDPLTGVCGPFKKATSTGVSATGALGLELIPIRGLSVSFEARYYDFQLSRRHFRADAEVFGYLLGIRYWFRG
jgi:opacity protein-like surface antigen